MTDTAVVLQPRSLTLAKRDLEGCTAIEIVMWAVKEHRNTFCLTTSFADTVLLDIVMAVDNTIPVVFLDTGFHFPETLETVRKAQQRYDMDLRVIKPKKNATTLYETDTDGCCQARKVDPLNDFLVESGFTAWLSGLRRSDSSARAAAPIASIDKRGLIKVNPIANWTDEQTATFVERRNILINPLLSNGYSSIGCWPCTQKTSDADARAGRWQDSEKTECGIHLE